MGCRISKIHVGLKLLKQRRSSLDLKIYQKIVVLATKIRNLASLDFKIRKLLPLGLGIKTKLLLLSVIIKFSEKYVFLLLKLKNNVVFVFIIFKVCKIISPDYKISKQLLSTSSRKKSANNRWY